MYRRAPIFQNDDLDELPSGRPRKKKEHYYNLSIVDMDGVEVVTDLPSKVARVVFRRDVLGIEPIANWKNTWKNTADKLGYTIVKVKHLND